MNGRPMPPELSKAPGQEGPANPVDQGMDGKVLLERIQEQMQGVLLRVPDGVVVLDAELRLTQITADAATLLKSDPVASLGASVFDLFDEKDRSIIELALSRPGEVAETIGEKVPALQIVALAFPDSVVIGLAKPTAAHPTKSPKEAPDAPSSPLADLIAEIAESRDLTTLANALTLWLTVQRPETTGVLAIPTLESLVPVAQWPADGHRPLAQPVPIEETAAVRRGRPVLLDTPDPFALLPGPCPDRWVVPVYRGEGLVCVLAGTLTLDELNEVGYHCGLQIQRFAE